jgi:prevent-host-death family protein
MVRRSAPVEIVMNLTETKQNFSKVVNQVARGEARVVVEKSGLQAAVLISVDEYVRFKAREEQRRHHLSEFAKAAMEFSKGFEDVPEEEIEAELDRIRKEFRELTDRERPG